MLLANIFGGQDMIVILAVILLLFGGKKLPELMRGIGKGMGELQKGIEESKRNLQMSLHEDEDQHKVHEITPRTVDNVQPYGSTPEQHS